MQKIKMTNRNTPEMKTILSNFPSKSRYAEAYRTLRTNIYFSVMEKELNSLVITSAMQGEGKTTTVANLAYTIAQTGKSVLMVDADLRRASLTARFGLQKAIGFSNIVADILGRHINNGKVSDYGLRDLIKLISLQQRSCILRIDDADNETELTFLKGELVDIYWKNRPDSQKLACSLMREKLLTENEAELALGHQKKSTRRLGQILLTLGLIEEKELSRILSVQMIEAFRVATDMEHATFSIHPVSEHDGQLSTLATVNFSQLLSDLLSSDEGDTFIKKNIESNILETEEKNLYLLPGGSIPPNPSELIGSPRTSYLLKMLKDSFDVVIIDSSPIIPASDALLLSSQVDGAVLVVRVGYTARALVKDSAQQLAKAKTNVLGVLLNRADVTSGAYYKYYQSYYGS
jgi:capsular exopolysaccharide synthesis family protein